MAGGRLEEVPRIGVKADKCTGCRLCEYVCSSRRVPDGFNPSLAAIVVKFEGELEEELTPVVCRQCEDAPCAEACPAGALSVGDQGVVLLDEQECTGCGLCVEACPYGAIHLPPSRPTPIKCDLCGGAPLCVEFCTYGALALE